MLDMPRPAEYCRWSRYTSRLILVQLTTYVPTNHQKNHKSKENHIFFCCACHFRAKDLYRRPSLIFPPNFEKILGTTRPPCCRQPHLRAVQASYEPCRGSRAAEGPRRGRARRRRGLHGSATRMNAALRSVLTWRQFGRDEGARALQGRLT